LYLYNPHSPNKTWPGAGEKQKVSVRSGRPFLKKDWVQVLGSWDFGLESALTEEGIGVSELKEPAFTTSGIINRA